MSERVAVGLLVAYFLLSIEVYLATYTVGKFHLSVGAFSPTELRLLLIAGNVALLFKPMVNLAGRQYLLFDVGGTIGIIGMAVALLVGGLRVAGGALSPGELLAALVLLAALLQPIGRLQQLAAAARRTR